MPPFPTHQTSQPQLQSLSPPPTTNPTPPPKSPTPQSKSPTPPPISLTPQPKSPSPQPSSPISQTPPAIQTEEFADHLANLFLTWAQTVPQIEPTASTPKHSASTPAPKSKPTYDQPSSSKPSIPRAIAVQAFYLIPSQLESKMDHAILLLERISS